MNRIVLAMALAVIIQGCVSPEPDRARGQKLTCVSPVVWVGMIETDPQTGFDYRVVELHSGHPRCGGVEPVLAVVEPMSASVREEARREEEARQQEAARKHEAEVAANRRRNHERELACISSGGTWRKDIVDLYNEGKGECEARPQSRSLSCETYKLGNRVYTDCR